MGNSIACLCSGNKDGDQVVVMKENGVIVTFHKRAVVREVLAGHPGYKVVRYGSDRPVLADEEELKTDRLYFLMPEKLAKCNPTYNRFLGMAESKGLLARPKALKGRDGGPTAQSNMSNGRPVGAGGGQVLLFEGSGLKKSPPWRPGLQTIPEAPSPPKYQEIS